MICLPYPNHDSFDCQSYFQTCVDVASLVSLPTSKTDLGRLTTKYHCSICPSGPLVSQHDGIAGDAISPSPPLVNPPTSKCKVGRLAAMRRCSVSPSAALSALNDSSGSEASSLSSSAESFRYHTHAWSRNMGFVCGCTPSSRFEDISTPAQRAGLAFENEEEFDVMVEFENKEEFDVRVEVDPEPQASGISKDSQCLESPICNGKPSRYQSYEASLAAASMSQQSAPFQSYTKESQHISIKPMEQSPDCGSPAITPGFSSMDSGSVLSEVTLETKNVMGSWIQPYQRVQAAQVKGIDTSLDSSSWQGKKSGSCLHTRVQDVKMGIEEDQDHFRGFSLRGQMSEATQYAHVESGMSEDGYESHRLSSPAQDEHVTQESVKDEALGSTYVATGYPDSLQFLKETNSALEEPNNDTDNISVVRLPAYRISYLNWSSKFTESLLYLESMGVDTGKLIREEPIAVTYDIKQLRELVRALEGLGLYWKDLGKIFNLCPKIFHLSPDKDLKLVTDFLFDEAGLSPKDFRKVIKRCPRLLACNVADQLLPTLMFLRTLGFSHMGQMIANNATLLSFNVEKKLVPRLKYLESLGFTHRQAVSMVVRFPALFNYKVEDNLEPKYEYLLHEMGGSNRDLLVFPQYFGYSLANRIIPRYQCIARRKVSLSLQAMLILSEAEFNAKFS